MKQLLPIGLQSFKEIRTRGYLYVDKTQHIHQLATKGKYYFLVRPRRFGKSLLINTLAELFRGEKELFKDLWIEDQWDWTQQHPVIQIGFSSMGYKELGLEAAIAKRLKEQALLYNIELTGEGNSQLFRELIDTLFAQHGRVVILIDEYDKPIIDFLEELDKANAHRDILKTFYSVLKDSDEKLRMVFITGVSKFSRMSIFSELNNLSDLTMHPRYATMLGYTQEELEHNFADRIERLADNFDGRESLLAQMKDWYNGYRWHVKKARVYNPFSILNFFDVEEFRNFWFETGTPTFLIKLLKEKGAYKLSTFETSSAAFGSFDLENISYATLLFQTGYLTLKAELGMDLYELGYPNREVQKSLVEYLIAGYQQKEPDLAPTPVLRMAHALAKGDVEELIDYLNALLGSIPYDWHQATEAYYHTIMHLAFSLIGVHIQSEIHTAKGRLDSVIHTDHTIYIIELKLDRSVEEALIQIEEKGYAVPYMGQNKPIVAIGINFSSTKKEVEKWEMRKVN